MTSMATVEFNMFLCASIIFMKGKKPKTGGTARVAYANAENLENVDGCSAELLGQLESLLVQPEVKRRRLSNPMDSRILVEIHHRPAQMGPGFFNVRDSAPNGLLERLADICGGYENAKAELELDFGASDDKLKLTRQDKILERNVYCRVPSLCGFFNFTDALAEKWRTQAKFTGCLTLKWKLNQEAVNQIQCKSYSPNIEAVHPVYRKLLEEAETFGDAVILLKNGTSVHCHKGLLAAQSDVFKAMFTSGMKEANSSTVEMLDISERGVRALLVYLYCADFGEALQCSVIATELLTVADKYGINKLFQAMKKLVMEKCNEWFSVAAALNLLFLGKSRNEEDEFKEMEDKAKVMLVTKSKEELKQSSEFQELMNDPQIAFEMCTYFMQSSSAVV